MIDLLVAGGGPAGLATAIHAAAAGMEAVVVEPRPTPVDKACGEGVMPTGVQQLRSLGVRVTGRELRGISYRDGRGRGRGARADFHHGHGLGVRRTALHAALARRAADLGIRVVPGRVTEVRQGPDAVAAAGMRARWMVAADGLHSPIRRALGLQLPDSGPRRYGLRRHYRMAPWTEYVEVYWSASGEAYVTPVAADRGGDALVGVTVLSSVRSGYNGHLERFPELRDRLTGPAAGPVRGAGPLRQRVRRRVAGRVLLVGDAAGYVDALTGEGIALGLASAGAAVRCLTAGRPAEYEAVWQRLTWRHRMLTGVLVGISGHAPAARLIVPATSRMPAVFGAAVQALQ